MQRLDEYTANEYGRLNQFLKILAVIRRFRNRNYVEKEGKWTGVNVPFNSENLWKYDEREVMACRISIKDIFNKPLYIIGFQGFLYENFIFLLLSINKSKNINRQNNDSNML
tara:strand:+ start:208 stop:543 length:336 start_codon:yes stop_codon:yes gene_type:complete